MLIHFSFKISTFTLIYLTSVSELFVDTPESGQADRIQVHIDISVFNIACQCKIQLLIIFYDALSYVYFSCRH